MSGADKIGLAEHNGDDNNAHDKIDGSSGGNDYHALPQGLVVERVLILAVLVLAFHADISADWQNAHGIVSLALLLFEDGGTHADRELVDLDLEKLCKKEMAEFMEHYDDAEEKYSHKKRPDFAPNCRKRQRGIQKHIKNILSARGISSRTSHAPFPLRGNRREEYSRGCHTVKIRLNRALPPLHRRYQGTLSFRP